MILIDTTPLVALCDGRDSYHQRAIRHLARFQTERLATCEPVLVEACFHLPHRAQRSRLRAVLRQFEVASVPQGHDEALREEILSWLLKYADHEPDWADACLAVLCGRNDSFRVWTYDREFRTTWRRPDGSRIPLAPAPAR